TYNQSTASTAEYYGLASSIAAPIAGLTAPTGGLIGNSILVDTKNIVGFVAEPASIRNYATTAQHYLSSDENFYLLPSLASGNVLTSERVTTYDAVGAPTNTVATYTRVVRDYGLDDQNVLPRTSVPSGINPMPISDALLATQLGNQYFLGAGTVTDFVVTTPMRKHAIYNNYSYVAAAGNIPVTYSATLVTDPVSGLPIGDIPVGGAMGDATAAGAYWNYEGLLNDDVNASVIYYNREEGQDTPATGDFSPPIATITVRPEFPREVNILSVVKTLGTAESVLGSANAQQMLVAGGFDNGFVQLAFFGGTTDYNLAGARYFNVTTPANGWLATTPTFTTGTTANGVPLTGFMATRSAVGAGNVGETIPHFYQKAY
ncbi:MAG: hypothetical protein ABGZ19_08945, partial [Verrucomicrobiales bacterium]